MFGKSAELPAAEAALPGRDASLEIENRHYVLDAPLKPPFPDGVTSSVFGMGCFWGAEKCFWQIPGVYTTAVGYAAGITRNPTYQEICTGMTGHNEVVLVVFYPDQLAFSELLRVFWESHNPTQGMRQGNDVGTQYRSGVYYSDEGQREAAQESLASYQQSLAGKQFGEITTEILVAPEFYYAEGYHQQYLAKNPAGYCGLGGTGVCLEAS
jgi:peptide-methionine (S)-S-oxide reductase